jgi:hypothetical protein
MSEVNALLIKNVDGITSDDNKKYALVDATLVNDEKIVLAIPNEALMGLIASCAAAYTENTDDSRLSSGVKSGFHTAWYEAMPIKDSEEVMVSFQLLNRGFLRFRLDHHAADGLRKVLSGLVGSDEISQKSEKPSN